MLQIFKKNIKRLIFRDLKFSSPESKLKIEKLGSSYGGWMIPTGLISRDSICYLAGAGEDISFDVTLVKRFGCSVQIFDPTPRSKLHFQKLIEAAKEGKEMYINNNPKEAYDLNDTDIELLQFHEFGIWKQNDVLKFYAPVEKEHVSHSISNLQGTESYFEAPVKSINHIMQLNAHNHLDILKLDVEGAEYDIIESILHAKISVKILCVEFHKQKETGLRPIQAMISKLEANGYFVTARENLDFTFLHKKWLN